MNLWRRIRRVYFQAVRRRTRSRASRFEPLEPRLACAAVPDFSLIDINPNATTSNQPVSPRDYLQQVSGWYFTHTT